MSNTKDMQIQTLLDSTGKAGPELTHSLRTLGNGKMADGLVELWKAGQHNGAVKGATITALAFSAVIGGYILIKNAIKDRQIKKVIAEIQTSPTVDSAKDEDFVPATRVEVDTQVKVDSKEDEVSSHK